MKPKVVHGLKGFLPKGTWPHPKACLMNCQREASPHPPVHTIQQPSWNLAPYKWQSPSIVGIEIDTCVLQYLQCYKLLPSTSHCCNETRNLCGWTDPSGVSLNFVTWFVWGVDGDEGWMIGYNCTHIHTYTRVHRRITDSRCEWKQGRCTLKIFQFIPSVQSTQRAEGFERGCKWTALDDTIKLNHPAWSSRLSINYFSSYP